VPANRKWMRNLCVAKTLVETLEPYKNEWMQTLAQQSAQRIEELQQYRATNGKLLR
jgi:hypothetical protein